MYVAGSAPLSEAELAIWHHRINQIRNGKGQTYRHHPLEELAVFIKR